MENIYDLLKIMETGETNPMIYLRVVCKENDVLKQEKRDEFETTSWRVGRNI